MSRAKARRAFVWFLLVSSTIGWPVCQFTVAKNEPPVILGISFLALIFSALTAIWVEEQNNNKKIEAKLDKIINLLEKLNNV
jgi:hypothetical protein